jgi:hypothetical protein
MRRVQALVSVTLWMAVAACGSGGDAIDAAPPADVQGGTIDAGPDDAGAPDAAPEVGVRCGPTMTLCSKEDTQGCCDQPPDAPACEPLGGLCTGDLTSCDGVEDCSNPGDVCCTLDVFAPTCAAVDDCSEANHASIVCHYDQECLGDRPNCCGGRCVAEVCL